jgi:hypothetical protein
MLDYMLDSLNICFSLNCITKQNCPGTKKKYNPLTDKQTSMGVTSILKNKKIE